MAETTISNMQLNNPFLYNYINAQILEKSAFIRSGIVEADPNVNNVVATSNGSGKLINLPFFKDLTGEDAPLDEGSALTLNNIATSADVAVIHRRGKAWGASDLAKAISGQDIMKEIGNLVADYRIRQQQAVALASLKGVFADNVANDSSDLVMDISTASTTSNPNAQKLTKETLLYASQLLGDAKDKLVGIAMHSAVETKLADLSMNSQTYTPADAVKGTLGTFQGKSIIMDDSIAYNADSGVCEIILFAKGAFAYAPCPMNGIPSLETDRDALKGTDYLISRDYYIMHPRGFAFIGSVGNSSPTNTALESATAWDRVYDKKAVRVCKLICKI